MLWHRQAIFESKRDKLSSSAEGRIRTHQGLRHQIASRLNARWQTNWAVEDQAKNLNSTARPYDQRAFSQLDPTAVWHSHLALAMYIHTYIHAGMHACMHTYIHTYIHAHMFVVVNFDALPVPMISEHSAHLTPLSVDFYTWLWRYTCLLSLISMLCHRQAIFKSKGDKLCSSAECRIWTRGPRHQIASRLNARWQTDWAIEDQAKKLELDSPCLWSVYVYVYIYI